jgi:hypothetical protein
VPAAAGLIPLVERRNLAVASHMKAIARVIAAYFLHHLPARSAFVTDGRALDECIELARMATRTESKR